MQKTTALMVLLAGLIACSHGERPQASPDSSPHTNAVIAEIDLAFVTDLEGYLAPCGCQSTSLGGLDRVAEALRTWRTRHPAGGLVVVGNTLFEDGGLHQRDNTAAQNQEIWKAETIIDVLSELGPAAAMFGPGDRLFGEDPLQRLRSQARFPVMGSGDGEGGVQQRTISVGPHTVGLLAFVPRSNGAMPVADWAKNASGAAAKLRSDGAALVVGMSALPPRETRRLAASLKGVGFLVAGGRVRDEPSAPERIGETVLLTGARHGRGLLTLSAQVQSGQVRFHDLSDWSRQAATARQQAKIADLQSRIAVWEKDSAVDPQLLAAQRDRLAELQRGAELAAPHSGASTFKAEHLPLPQGGPKDEATSKRMAAYDARVNAYNREAFADRKPPKAAPGAATYVGSATCKGCHAPAYAWWQQHPHGTAYDTLRERNKEYNLSCAGCHLTGYEQPGGSTITHNEGLLHVGCESCHGPGSLHLGDPKKIIAQPQEGQCLQCHNPEHSDLFQFETYRGRLLSPGHGLPLGTEAR